MLGFAPIASTPIAALPVNAYSLVFAQGSYTYTGESFGLIGRRSIAFASGSYTYAGEPFGLTQGQRHIAFAAGSYSYTGESFALRVRRGIVFARGTYALTWQSTVFDRPGRFTHFRANAADGAQPKYILTDSASSMYEADLSLAPRYVLTDILPED